jgi:enoyl-CoA hydratase/carnithine racemase
VQGARFALTEVTRGIMPGGGGTQLLPRSIGSRRAKEVIFTGEPFEAADALQWGIVNRLCAPGEVVSQALATARRIAANAPISIRQAKKAIDFGAGTDLPTGLQMEIESYYQLIPTEDRREGIAAFNEKRTPVFKGR